MGRCYYRPDVKDGDQAVLQGKSRKESVEGNLGEEENSSSSNEPISRKVRRLVI
jgi:hypothetical protein